MELNKDNTMSFHWSQHRLAAGIMRVTSAFAPESTILSSI